MWNSLPEDVVMATAYMAFGRMDDGGVCFSAAKTQIIRRVGGETLIKCFENHRNLASVDLPTLPVREDVRQSVWP